MIHRHCMDEHWRPEYDFSNKVVLITGGTGALGRTIIQAFVACKSAVISSYINDTEIDRLETGIKSAVQLIKSDVTKEEEVKRLVSDTISKYGLIHILVNVIGGYIGGKTVAELDIKEWDLMMDLNLKSAFLISKHILLHMLSSKYGKIIHISSRTGLKSGGYDSAYAASKSGLIRLIESMSEEVKESNINVNCIIDTESNRRAMPKADFTRWIHPVDLAKVVLFLCSEEARVITGAAIPTFGLS